MKGLQIPEHPLNDKLKPIFRKEMITWYLAQKLDPFMIDEKDKLGKNMAAKLRRAKMTFYKI